MSDKKHETMPGEAPTDEDLRHDVELTRQELAETAAALAEKADVKTRVRTAVRNGTDTVRTRGDELVGKLPPAVATRVSPAWHTVCRRPAVSLGSVAAVIIALAVWRGHR